MHHLLTDPVISLHRGATTTESVSLPEIYARLVTDGVAGFAGLARHQAPAWYQLLAQLGAIALHRADESAFPDDPGAWRHLLAELTPDSADTAWSLVTDDPARPAFLQPPTKRFGHFKPVASTPDALDVLVTAKNHDLKQARAASAPPHLWLYALVNLQTTQGYSGRGQPGVARMNGGLSSRVLVDRRPCSRWGPRVVRAVRMLLRSRDQVLRSVADTMYRNRRGLALTWLCPWDDDAMLSPGELDPYFIEVCRRLRLIQTDDGIEAWGRLVLKGQRTNAKQLKGNLGDPWVPLDLRKDPPTSLTVSAGGFDYRLTQRILFRSGESRRPLALRPLPDEQGKEAEIHLAALTRGQGKTEGFHERVVPLPASVRLDADSDPDDDESTLEELSEDMVKRAGATRKVLRQAVIVYVQGPDNPNFKKADADTQTTRFDREVDDAFFGQLFAAPERGYVAADRDWQVFLRRTACRLAGHAFSRLSPPSARREKARAAAEAVLIGGLRRQLPLAFPSPERKEEAA